MKQIAHEEIDHLITKLLEKYEATGTNIDRKPALFAREVLQLEKIAPFLSIDSYLYFLSEMSTLILKLNDGSHVTFYGLDDWDDGMNMLDYSIPGKNGFHMFMDICNPEGEILYFSYNSKDPNVDVVWIAPDSDGGEGTYTKTDMNFIDVLKLIEEAKIQSLNKKHHENGSR